MTSVPPDSGPVGPQGPRGIPFRFTDPRQQRIHRRLLLIGPGPAAFYRDACQLISSPFDLQSTSHLVAHLLREVESALRDVLESIAPELRGQGSGRVPWATLELSRLFRAAARWMRTRISGATGRNRTHAEEVRAILRALGIANSDPVALAWLQLARGRGDNALHRRAHRKDLTAPLPLDAGFQGVWEDIQAILDAVLDRFETQFATFLEILDALLVKSAPSKADMRRLRNHLPQSLPAQTYFFDRLQSADWLEPLRKAGFFKSPRGPMEDSEGGGVRLPPWPPSRYLVRVVKQRPREVLRIILDADSTQNGRVHADFVDAANGMPPELAVQVAPKVADWFESSFGIVLFTQNSAELVAHLASGGQPAAALALAKGLLALSPEPGEKASLFRPEPVTRIEPWSYGRVLERLSPNLSRFGGEQWLELLSNLVCDLLRSSARTNQSLQEPEDRSNWWRPAVEDHEQNEPRHSIGDKLVEALRDSAEKLVARDPRALHRIVAALEMRRWKLFQRIALHLLRAHPEAGHDLVVERLTNRDLYDDRTLHHEFYLLLEASFSNLSPVEQAPILGWIDTDCDQEAARETLEKSLSRTPTGNEVDEYLAWRQFRELFPLRHGLRGSWKERYQELADRLGEPEHPDFLAYTSGGSWAGFPSPRTADELGRMPIEELTAFLSSWQPTGKPLDASPEGLGRNLTSLVAERPDRFAPVADQFRDLDPTYVRAVIDGFTKAIEENRPFHWCAVLDLCESAIGRDRDLIDREHPVPDADPDWSWTRKAVTRLLAKGLAEGGTSIPLELRFSVWRILEPLVEDPEPSIEYEAQYGGSNMDPATLSINTVRGDAMHTVIRYGLWVRRGLERQPDSDERLGRGFDEMPELRIALERHLDLGHDPALAIRAVYGQWFPWLALMDEEWARENARRVFPTDPDDRSYWNAAWGTYVTFCPPYDNAFAILSEQYAHAVESLGTDPPRVALGEDPECQLAEHLLTLYWRGRIKLEDRLLRRFYEKASAEVRGYALEFVGRSLGNTQGEVVRDALDRLRRLWEQRLDAAVKASDVSELDAELASFAWWFRSEKFDDRWATTQLIRSLELSQRTRRESFLVMERLTELASSMPLQAVECARLLVDADEERLTVVGNRKELRQVLHTALRSGDARASDAARELINRLVAWGHIEFRDLLAGE